jgi:hypothetical protein
MKRSSISLKICLNLILDFIILRVIVEFYQLAPSVGTWVGRFSMKWGLAFIVFTLLCLLLLVGVSILLWLPVTAFPKIQAIGAVIARRRERLGQARYLLAAIAVGIPIWFFLYSTLGSYFHGAYLRLLFLLVFGTLFAILVTKGETTLVRQEYLYLGILLTASLFFASAQLTEVTNYPFSLSWSEGNRLYDFSVQVDPGRYQYPGKLTVPYSSPGRYLLWGILFLIPNAPIWMHRLWDAILWTVPSLALGYLLARGIKAARWSSQTRLIRWIFALWIFLFLAQGPIYPPLIISAMLVVVLVRPQKLLLSLVGVALAGYYASASRWTWLPASAAWAAIIWVSDLQIDKGASWKKIFIRLVPITLITAVGIGAGALANPKLLSPKVISTSTAMSQPLLWYRLFPNATNPDGILLELIIATLPLIALLIWLIVRKSWSPNWLQSLAYIGASLGFLAMGLVASVKIGGGNNLHNLDMFLITLAIISALAFRDVTTAGYPSPSVLHPPPAPRNEGSPVIMGLLAILICLPAWNAVKGGAPLELPPQEEIQQGLQKLSGQIEKAQPNGEILFIDQRQLLTFGVLQGVDLVPDYEKKYMMDQAMAGNAAYFEDFYHDLENKRFSLIITEPLWRRKQGDVYSFNEENNAWVKWVVKPLFCYYTPIIRLSDVRIQMLVPNPNPQNCR